MHVRSGKTNIFVLDIDENWVDQNKKKWIDYQISAVEVAEQFPTSSRSEHIVTHIKGTIHRKDSTRVHEKKMIIAAITNYQ